jgi:hypothetical protein
MATTRTQGHTVKLSTIIHPARNTDDLRDVDPARAEHERLVRKARIELARRQSTWTEIPETRLVRRGPFLVDAETDLVWIYRRGHVFEPGRATVGFIPDGAAMTYAVDQNDNIIFVEHPGGPRTWSEIVERKAWRG